MSDLDKLTERDILVRIDTKIGMMEPRVARAEADIVSIREDIAGLRVIQSSSKSYFDGAKAMWGFILSLPVGGLALFIGTQT